MVEARPAPSARRDRLIGLLGSYGQLLRFGLSGVSSTIFYLAVVNILVAALHVEPVRASAYAYLSALAISYLLQSRFTFRVRDDAARRIVRFAVVSLTGLGFSLGVMWLVVDVLEMPYLVGALALCIVIPLTNYLVFQHWVFARSPLPEDAASKSDHPRTDP